tara:strand:- start:765 stop:2024 length:1260 start_codon:yes stop_codon:yes gene_type:complete
MTKEMTELNESQINQTDSENYFNNEKEDKLIKSFNKILKQFLKELDKSFPELNIKNIKEYKNIDDQEDKFLLYFMNQVESNIAKISQRDESLFEQDDTYFLRDINFGLIWKSNTSENNKEAIWKFLQTMYLIGKPFISNKNDIQAVIENFNNIVKDNSMNDKELLNNIQDQSQHILNIIENLHQERDKRKTEGFKEGMEFEGNLPDFIENSKIGKLAQELSSELNMEDFGFGNATDSENPQDIFKNVLGQNPQKLMGLIQSVGTKIQDKLQDSDLNQEDLLGEAQQMMASLGGKDMMANIFKDPKMKDMFKNMSQAFGADIDPEEFQNVANQFAQGGFPNMGKGQRATVDQNKVKKMSTRARLQKKLEARRSAEESNGQQVPLVQLPDSNEDRILEESIQEVITTKKKKKKKKKPPSIE